MQPEELLETLRGAGMDDEAIKALLGDTLASLEGPAEGEGAPAESDAEKADRIFGAI